MKIEKLLESAVKRGASDLFLIAGLPVTYKVQKRMEKQEEALLSPQDTRELIGEVYELADRDRQNRLEQGLDDDFSFAASGLGRFRINVFRQRGSYAAVIRVIQFGLPDPKEIGIPDEVMNFASSSKGLVLITGAAGTGKSTTLACIIDRINSTREGHIVTMEDPIEYVHRHKRCIVSQREIAVDVPDYPEALSSAMRESPDVILLGEMRNQETISAAMSAAEVGVLLFSTMHTFNAANTIGRIVDAYPAIQQHQIKMQLALTLEGIVCQQLVPGVDGTLIPAFEVLKSNVAIQNMIREDKLHQLDSAIQACGGEGMCTMDMSLLRLVKEGRITKETALMNCIHLETMTKRLAQG